jgi:hypothetical protein
MTEIVQQIDQIFVQRGEQFLNLIVGSFDTNFN